MSTRQITLSLVALSCVAVTGCQSTAPAEGGVRGLVAGIFARKPTQVAMSARPAAPIMAPAVSQAQLSLAQGMVLNWQVQTAQEGPGQVKSGRAIIGPDGTMVVGPYGTCKVAGLTLDQAAVALESHLAAYLQTPTVQLSAVVPAASSDLAWRSTRGEPSGETVIRTATFRRP